MEVSGQTAAGREGEGGGGKEKESEGKRKEEWYEGMGENREVMGCLHGVFVFVNVLGCGDDVVS